MFFVSVASAYVSEARVRNTRASTDAVSADLEALVTEIERAIAQADTTSEAEHQKALDPALSLHHRGCANRTQSSARTRRYHDRCRAFPKLAANRAFRPTAHQPQMTRI